MNLNTNYIDELAKLGISPINHFVQTRQDAHPKTRLEKVRRAALDFREGMLSSGKPAKFYKSIDLVRVPYPSRYGLLNAGKVPSPFLHIMNRLFIVQFETHDGLKTLLFSPSDIDANGETPFFKNLASSWGPFSGMMEQFLAPKYHRVEDALASVGIMPEQIDFISYDHLHTQDIRKWLGSNGSKGMFPNAKLLVMRQEWESTNSLLPPQQQWYCPNGINGIDMTRVVLLDSSVMLGDSVALVHSPGHTEGNHSLVVNTVDGLLVTSENGISADSFSPLHSRIPGLHKYAKHTGMEVVLNGNTLEGGLDQYISMVMEKTIAGPSKRDPNFCNFVPSSELTPYWGFPGIKPSFYVGQLEYGIPVIL